MPYVAIIKDLDGNESKQTFNVSGGDISSKIEDILSEYNRERDTSFGLVQVSCYAHNELEIDFPFKEIVFSNLKKFYNDVFNKDKKSPWKTNGGIWKEIRKVNSGLDIFYQLSLFGDKKPLKKIKHGNGITRKKEK